ncbi:MAG: hypothetical protein HY898_02060 [Deltaproteobacteria bacterium]|nr:hypothetical protein [Deltaproteobacteria bacterium]
MLAVVAALTCSSFAVIAALSRLRAVGRAVSYDPEMLAKALPKGVAPEFVRRLASVQAKDDADVPWEGELLRAVSEARTQEEARAGANEILLDVESRFSWGTHVPAASARIALFGALLAGVLLLARDARLTNEIVDVVALGAGGAMISLMAGTEATKNARARRKAVDVLVDRVLAARGLAAGESEESGTNSALRGGGKEPG